MYRVTSACHMHQYQCCALTYSTDHLQCGITKLIQQVHHSLPICLASQVINKVFSGNFVELWH